MAFSHHESRPDHVRVQPVLLELAERYGETVHYAVLDTNSIIYRSKVDPTGGSIRLTSTIGGRNPAHCTAIGKLLLSSQLLDLAAIQQWLGDRALPSRTANTLTTPEALHEEFVRIRNAGYATDDQENELGVNCLAVPYYFSSPTVAVGAVSISALVYRTPLSRLVDDVETIRAIVDGRFEPSSP
jgi:DNA-binding IclR family transcriptional regulator